ncbi:hypothetical protein F5Y19DRAFT_483386 [Xylariaceae sp. FL1651]|nr:hypothetical protein F5Y19DRAFT_483386 [Xylariaceae sp. FL1651]
MISINSIAYQSGNIGFSDWVTVLTLSLAPLIGHIVAGCPEPSILCARRPKWDERICHYNPTSILWRYALIADRRIRARAWNPLEMAGANALFWTSHGWDGSEEMVIASMPYCKHLPEAAVTTLWSHAMFKTVVVTLQGAQALVVLSASLAGRSVGSFVPQLAVDFIFWPLSLIGLFRLCCAFWLTEEYSFSPLHSLQFGQATGEFGLAYRTSLDSLLAQPAVPFSIVDRFRSASYGPSRFFRTLFFLAIIGYVTLAWTWLIPQTNKDTDDIATTTAFLVLVFYIFWITATSIIVSYCFVRGYTTTIIPCINSFWYKAYTIFIIAFALAVFIIACIETTKTPCGKFTSLGTVQGIWQACNEKGTEVFPLDPTGDPTDYGFGVAKIQNPTWHINHTKPGSGDFWVYNFTGYCLESFDRSWMIKFAATLDVFNVTTLDTL